MLCCPRYQWIWDMPPSHNYVDPMLTVYWISATIFVIIIPQISQNIDINMPLLSDFRSYIDLTYALLPQISMKNKNTNKSLLHNFLTHCLVDNCNYFVDYYSPYLSKNESLHAITQWLKKLYILNICSVVPDINGED